ncbi:MAG TPA: serine/threonine-protein kinase [Casimicrobiaceae bacterium]|jgi:serine/threonine-protein kinase|nr:serine/threonine-protein kinase [Casimicrobiaceae bacterium]
MRPGPLGRYEILEEIGHGAMGVVFRARDPLIDRIVAIKTITVGLSRIEAEEFEKRFDREARSAGRLSHPNIVTIYDVGKSGDVAYFAMELLEGQSLRAILDSGVVLPASTIADIAAQVADGLAAAHQAGVVHCDVKPANIVVLPSGLVKITDFGIAMLPTGSRSFVGNVVGSPKYISPERVLGRPVDARSDVFSLGAVLYEVLTGTPPFVGTALDEILHNVINHSPEPPTVRNPSLPAEFDAIVARALAKHPDDRYPSAREMSADLRQLALVGPRDAFGAAAVKERPAASQPGDSTVTAAYEDHAAPPRSGWRSPFVRYGLPAALLVAVAAGAMYLARPPSPVPVAALAPLDPQREIPSLPLAAPATGESAADAQGAGAVASTPPPPAAPPAKPAARARVGFAVTPWGEVYIDGRKTGITPPLNEIRLPPGKHTIEIRNTTFPPHRQTVDLRADGSVRIKHKFE